jgi:hypothetical protein
VLISGIISHTAHIPSLVSSIYTRVNQAAELYSSYKHSTARVV